MFVKECCCFSLKTGSILIGILDFIKDSLIIWVLLNRLQEEDEENLPKYQEFLILCAITTTSSILLLVGIKWNVVQFIDIWLVVKPVVTLIVGIFSIWSVVSGLLSGENDITQGVFLFTLVFAYVIGELFCFSFSNSIDRSFCFRGECLLGLRSIFLPERTEEAPFC